MGGYPHGKIPVPITVKLTCAANGKAVELLKNSPTLRARMAAGRIYAGLLSMDVLSLLIAEDIYGRQYAVPPADFEMWAAATAQPVLFESDLGSTYVAGTIGIWNLPFLQWLKAVSLAAGEDLKIEYEHERGDMPYESAWWASYPASEVVETFGVQSYDGKSTPEWQKVALRYRNGQIEVP